MDGVVSCHVSCHHLYLLPMQSSSAANSFRRCILWSGRFFKLTKAFQSIPNPILSPHRPALYASFNLKFARSWWLWENAAIVAPELKPSGEQGSLTRAGTIERGCCEGTKIGVSC